MFPRGTHPTFQSPNCDRIIKTGQTVSHTGELGEPTVVQATRETLKGTTTGKKFLKINLTKLTEFQRAAHQKCMHFVLFPHATSSLNVEMWRKFNVVGRISAKLITSYTRYQTEFLFKMLKYLFFLCRPGCHDQYWFHNNIFFRKLFLNPDVLKPF